MSDLEVVQKELREMSPQYLGREHFMAFGEMDGSQLAARSSFSLLTARKAFPNDTRKPNFEALGLVIVRRTDTDMSALPEFAKFTRGDGGISATYLQERYAIGAVSLRHLMDSIRHKTIERPSGFGPNIRPFLFRLVDEALPDRPVWSAR